jgi:DNA-directed RNA polymerase specialized sigma24 family protein
VLLLRKRDGLSPDEIALRMGLTKATVYTYLIRAVAQFKAHFRNMSRES